MVLACIICAIGVASLLAAVLIMQHCNALLSESNELLKEAKKERAGINEDMNGFIAEFRYGEIK